MVERRRELATLGTRTLWISHLGPRFMPFVRRLVPSVISLVLAFAAPGVAQPAPERQVAGVVTDAETHSAVPGATVAAGDRRTVTDTEGRFSLRVPQGRTEIDVTAPGYFPLTTTIDLADRDALDTGFVLAPRSGFSSSVDVVASSPAAPPAAVAVAPAQVLRTPGALDNVFRTLQTLPGVSAAEEFGSRLAVRGGAPDQNLTVMDGVEIHDPYRLFGLTSAFNPEIIQRFELSTGGFSVKHGDRLSSLLLVENRDGTRQRSLAGSASLSITDANVVLEGRLPRAANGSWLVTARRTYYDLVASRVANQEFPRFADLQGKAVWDVAPGRSLSVFGLRSRQAAALTIDDEDASGEFQDDTRNDLAWARFDATIGTSAQSHTIVADSNSTSSFGVDAAFTNRSERSNAPDDDAIGIASVIFDRSLAVRDSSLRQEFVRAGRAHVVEAGAELHRLSTDLSFQIRGDRNPNATNGSSAQGGAGLPDSLISNRDVTRVGLWLLDRWQATRRASLEFGARVDRSGLNSDTQVSPRMTAAFTLDSLTKLRGAIGRYTQSPGYEKLLQSDYVLDITGPEVRGLGSEQAIQASAGLERQLRETVLLRLEGYYKRFDDLLIGRLEPEVERLARVGRYDFPQALAGSVPTDPIITTVPINEGRGRAYGFDLFMSRTTAPVDARVRGWASYTWGRAEREAYGRRYPFEYDRRHAFSAVMSYRLSSRWEIASTTRIASGFPRTPPIGLRIAGADDSNDRDGDAVTDEVLPEFDSAGRPVYAVDFGGVPNLNTGRLPVFARVDVRATWRPRGQAGRWELYAEIINVLNRKNAGAFDPQLEYDSTSDRPRIVEKRDQAIPLLPTIGLRFRF
jgi:hypothetical protein